MREMEKNSSSREIGNFVKIPNSLCSGFVSKDNVAADDDENFNNFSNYGNADNNSDKNFKVTTGESN